MDTCKHFGCTNDAAVNSKYCREHKREARENWYKMIREKAEERKSLLIGFRDMIHVAHQKGMEAAEKAVPVPMVVTETDGTPVAVVNDGPCGFAYVTLRPGTSSLARFLVKDEGWHKSYYGGVERSVQYFNQSLTRKAAYASAFAQHMRSAGYDAGSYDRDD